MITLLVNAYPESLDTTRLVVENNKNAFDKVIVICSPNNAKTISASLGVEVVIETDKSGTYWSGIRKGLERAVELDSTLTITLPGDESGVHISPTMIRKFSVPINDGSYMVKTNLFGVWAFSDEAIKTILKDRALNPWNPDFFLYGKLNRNIVYYPLDDFENSKQNPFFRLLGLKPRYYEERIVDEISEINSPRIIYSKKLAIQEKISINESYKLICETFLRFMPPALFSLVVSYAILLPSAGQVVNQEAFSLLIGSSIIAFIIILRAIVHLSKAHYKFREQLSLLNKREESL